MTGRKQPIGDKYKLVAQKMIIDGMPTSRACKEVGLSEPSWYKKRDEPDLAAYLEELREIKKQQSFDPVESLDSDNLIDITLRNVHAGLVDGNITNKQKMTEIAVRNIDKLRELGKQSLDLNKVVELMEEAGIKINQIVLPEEDADK